jgi:hypothetical protein
VLSLAAVCEKLPALEARTDRDWLGAAPTRTARVVGGEPSASRSEHGLTPAREFVDELFRRNAVAIDGFQRINAAIGATQAARAAGEFSASIRDLEELERQLRRYGR